ncbi:hypothetical protein [Arthrobacter sp. C9C5]|uniref:hypothetical protein n=1 Tax=Arthrobacter sp. C9C5 TaxID=2735267 RepID=UPI001585A3B6|nr:hypothetical protein [Arthrobacter sp. C9C5]NUU32949.1 hypothetical protein [Arthrobacter sp. C9C5]
MSTSRSTGVGVVSPGRTPDFTAHLSEMGLSPAVAEEIERRIVAIETHEWQDDSRQPLSASELTGYVLVSVAACIVGLLLVIL